MDIRVDIKIDKFTGFALLLPESIKNVTINYNRVKSFIRNVKDLVIYGIELDTSTCNFIGFIDTLTDEQCENIIDLIHIEHAPSPSNDYSGDWSTGYVDYENRGEFAGAGGDAGYFKDARDSFNSLMDSLGCYTVNPLGSDPCQHNNSCFDSCQGSCWGDINSDDWEVLESRTGTWVLIEQI